MNDPLQGTPPPRFPSFRRPRGRVFLAGCCLLIVCGVGCGSDPNRGYITHDEDLLEVEGVVRFEGRPCKNATVVFHRKESGSAAAADKPSAEQLPNPRGECDENGEFKLYTYAVDDGAPEGDYLVTVSWKDPEGTGREENFPELLPQIYQRPGMSGLTAQIKEGQGQLAFDLKRVSND